MNKVKMEESAQQVTMYNPPHLSGCAVKKQMPISLDNLILRTYEKN